MSEHASFAVNAVDVKIGFKKIFPPKLPLVSFGLVNAIKEQQVPTKTFRNTCHGISPYNQYPNCKDNPGGVPGVLALPFDHAGGTNPQGGDEDKEVNYRIITILNHVK